MKQLSSPEILKLSATERIQLVEDIWDSIIEIPDSISLTKEQKRELNRRLESYHLNPSQGSPWHEAKERIRRSL